jgi:uncharacterized protein (TIGR03067 family)
MFQTRLKKVLIVAVTGFLLLGAGVAGTRYALGDKPGEAQKQEKKDAAPPAKGTEARDDWERLQGNWEAVAVREGGKELGAEERVAVRVRFKGDEITFYPIKDEKARVTFRLDPAASPKAMTLTEQEGEDKGQSVPAIYELHGDRLKLCVAMKAGVARPTEFTSPDGSNLLLLDLKREPRQVGEDKDRLQGTWKAVKMESQGREATEDEVKKGTMVIKGDKLTTVRPDGFTAESQITIDPTQRPKTIDLVPQDGPDTEKGKTFRGIYKLDGDTLTLCMNGPDMERPQEFKTEAGSQVMLMTLKRETPAGGGK